MCKRDVLRECIQRRVKDAILIASATMSDRVAAEAIRQHAISLASNIAWHCCDTYEYMEIADIMEWKRTRVSRNKAQS